MQVARRWLVVGAAAAVVGLGVALFLPHPGIAAGGPAGVGQPTSSATEPAPSSVAPAGSASSVATSGTPVPAGSASNGGQANEALRPASRPVDARAGKQLGTPFTVNGIAVVSAKHRVSAAFKPKVTGRYPLTPAANRAIATLSAAIRKARLSVSVVSGYRSHASQAALYRRDLGLYGRAYTTRYVAKPGTSKHQTGLAVDLRSPTGRGSTFARTKEWRWLRAHAQNYGFVLRYPKGRTKLTGIGFEPWHWRYVGVAQAKAIRALGADTTIEQYLRLG